MDKIDQILAQDIGGNSIEHHGVKGQKWGVRRRRAMASAERVGATASSLTGAVVAIGGGKSGSKFSKLSRGLRKRADRNEAKANKIQAKTAAKEPKLKAKRAKRAKRMDKVNKAMSMKMSEVKSKAASRKAAKSAVSASKSREKDWNKMYTNRSSISTPELREKVNRLTLENQLKQQVSIANPAKKSAARKIITNVGTELLRNVANQAGQQILKQALKKVPV